jgi:hypothetical protein
MLFVPYVYAETPAQAPGSSIQKVSSDELVCTLIDVRGTRYSDRMWIFSVPQCTRGFDNGWDGYKMFGSPVTPQIFAMEAAGNFQVNSIPDINNSYLGFKAGEDTAYTLTFTHQLIETRYKKLYLIDSIANKTIDIYATGTKYAFVAHKTDAILKRFKIVTNLNDEPEITENTIATIIHVQGSRYTDSLTIITDSTATKTFSKGKDVNKTFGSPLAPQLYTMENDGNYQINSVNDINKTYLGFLPGEDNTYTLTFTNQNLKSGGYQELYLVDLVENKTIDIYANGTEYSFVAEQSNSPLKRFMIITSLPDQSKDIYSNNSRDSKTAINVSEGKGLNKKLKVFNSQNTIIIDNPYIDNGSLILYSAQSGSMVKQLNFNANGITTLAANVPGGVYIVKGQTRNEIITERIIIR